MPRIADLDPVQQVMHSDILPMVQGGVTRRVQFRYLPETPQSSAKFSLISTKLDLERVGLLGGSIDTFQDSTGVDFVNSVNVQRNNATLEPLPLVADTLLNTNLNIAKAPSNYAILYKNSLCSGKTLTGFSLDVGDDLPHGAGSLAYPITVLVFGADDVISAQYNVTANQFLPAGYSLVGANLAPVSRSDNTNIPYSRWVTGLSIPIPVDGGFVFQANSGVFMLNDTNLQTYAASAALWDGYTAYKRAYGNVLNLDGSDVGRNVLTGLSTVQYANDVPVGVFEFSSPDPITVVTEPVNTTVSASDAVISFVCSGETDALEAGNMIVEVSSDGGSTFSTLPSGIKVAADATLSLYTFTGPLPAPGTSIIARITVNQPNTARFHGVGVFFN